MTKDARYENIFHWKLPIFVITILKICHELLEPQEKKAAERNYKRQKTNKRVEAASRRIR
jgi:hypothetical protein